MIDVKEMIIELSEGNPGALTVLIQMVQAAEAQDVMFALPVLFTYMKENGLTGSEIWILYKDECGSDYDTFIQTLALRAEAEAITFEAASGD